VNKSEEMQKARADDASVYGFVLMHRALARAAIYLREEPAALRVLCVAVEYMNQEGGCRVGQDTIAARLGISRQAVNKHLATLEDWGIIESILPKGGVTKRYTLVLDEKLKHERYGQFNVDQRRKKKREKKKAQVAAPLSAPEATSGEPEDTNKQQTPEVVDSAPEPTSPSSQFSVIQGGVTQRSRDDLAELEGMFG